MTARDYALHQLDARDLPNWPGQLLRRDASAPPSDHRDLALAEQIFIGVVKNLLLLQYLISHYSGRPLKAIDPLVQKIIAIGLYQLRFLTRVPDSAAVDEAVKQARRFGRSGAAGLVNAVLRNATRKPNPELPPVEDLLRHAEVVLSHPPELLRRVRGMMADDQLLAFCRHNNAEPPTIVRLMAGHSPADLDTDGVVVAPHVQTGMFVVAGARQSHFARWASQGIAQVQDPTAARVVPAIKAARPFKPGEVVLDRCAGLGTKTLQLRDFMEPSGKVVAVDASGVRCEGLRRLISERRIENVQVFQAAMLSSIQHDLPQAFDRILVDAPCSNSGVLARRPEARYAQTLTHLGSLERLQDEILADSAPWVSAGGQLIYSTCSIWKSENEDRVAAFLSKRTDYKLLSQKATLPSRDDEPSAYCDGGYIAILQRA